MGFRIFDVFSTVINNVKDFVNSNSNKRRNVVYRIGYDDKSKFKNFIDKINYCLKTYIFNDKNKELVKGLFKKFSDMIKKIF